MRGPWVQPAVLSALVAACAAPPSLLPVPHPPGLFEADVLRVSDERPNVGSQAAALDDRAHDAALLRVHLYVQRTVDPALVGVARGVAHSLLSRAGVTTTWSTGTRAPTAEGMRPSREVVAVLRSPPLLPSGGEQRCGYARAEGAGGGFIAVWVPCVADFALRLSRSDEGRRHARLVMPRHDDLVGVVLAHEIAHVLGLGHAPSGIMRSGLHHDDLLALRNGTLTFQPREATRLRVGLRAASASRSARVMH